jgi:uncharacterized integral membrane protein
MRFSTLLTLIFLTPLGIVFAVANRGLVTLSLDPFSNTAPALALDLPLFMVVLAALFIGVLIGGAATSASRSKRNRKARKNARSVAQQKDANSQAGETGRELAPINASDPQQKTKLG